MAINKTFRRKIELAESERELRQVIRKLKASSGWKNTYNDVRLLEEMEERQKAIIRGSYTIDLKKKEVDFLWPALSTDNSQFTLTKVNVRKRGKGKVMEATNGFQLRVIPIRGTARCGVYVLQRYALRLVDDDPLLRFPNTEAIIPSTDRMTPTQFRWVRTIGKLNDRDAKLCGMTEGKTVINSDLMENIPEGGQMYEKFPTRPIRYNVKVAGKDAFWVCMPMHPPRW